MKKIFTKIIVAILSLGAALVLASVAYVLVKQQSNPVKEILKPNPGATAALSSEGRKSLDAEQAALNPTASATNTATQITMAATATPAQKLSGDVIDLLVLGVDSRQMQMESQTDVIMLVRIDKAKKKIKIVSIARDIYLKIPGYTESRINEALLYGGPELTVKTVNEYFGLDIKYYAVFNFMTAESVIDMIGPVTVTVDKDELNALNGTIRELNELSKGTKGSPLISRTGKQQLDGRQAVAYARLRPGLGSDIERTNRQREALLSLLQQAKKLPASRIPALIDKSLDAFYTNIPMTQYPTFAMDMYGQRNSAVSQMAIPVEGSYRQKQIVEMKYLVIDFEKNRKVLHDFLEK